MDYSRTVVSWMRRVRLPGDRVMQPLAAAQLVSVAGTQVTALALPTLAILTLNAGPVTASLLFALEFGLQALTAPLVGVVVDTVRSRQRLLVLTEVTHFAVISTVPLAAAFGHVTMAQVIVVASLSGVLAGITSVGVPAIVPQLVPADRLVPANASIAGGRSIGQIVGPALAGWLVQSVGAAAAMVVDAVSYAASGLLISRLRPTQRPAVAAKEGLFASLRAGLAILRSRPVLIRVAAAAAALNLGGSALGGLFTLYAYRRLNLPPWAVGLTFAAFSAAAVVGVATAKRVIDRLGLHRVIPVFAPLAAVSLFLIPAAAVLPALPTLLAYEMVFGYCATVWTIASVTLQQSLVPVEQLGRVMALSRTVAVVAIPVGAMGGGLLAGGWDLLPSLVAFAGLALAGTLGLNVARISRPGCEASSSGTWKRSRRDHSGAARAGATD
jgi:MFS family permease